MTVARVNATLTFPSCIILVVAMNPCPCGYFGDKEKSCDCTPNEIKRYTRKISGPLLDRIDIHVHVPRVKYEDMTSVAKAESSAVIRERVLAAREIQMERLREWGIFCNAQMSHAILKKTCLLEPEAQNLLAQAFQVMNLSARSYDRIIKVARTIADLDGAATIEAKHVGEAIQLRDDVGLNVE